MPRFMRSALHVLALALTLSAMSSAAPAEDNHPVQTAQFLSVKGEPLELVGYLRRPDGAGPFPAVVLLHGCGGNWRGMDTRWGTRFVRWGYAALSVDSYGPRGIKSVCGFFDSGDPPDHVWDAYGALNFLATQPFVAPGHVAVRGGSGGATMAGWMQNRMLDEISPTNSALPSRSILTAASSTGR